MLGVVLTKSCGTPKQVICRVVSDSVNIATYANEMKPRPEGAWHT